VGNWKSAGSRTGDFQIQARRPWFLQSIAGSDALGLALTATLSSCLPTLWLSKLAFRLWQSVDSLARGLLYGPLARAPLPDPALGVFFYDYKPAAWYTKHLDLGLLLLLSLFRALLPRPTARRGHRRQDSDRERGAV